jgi:hydroxyacylglutathione hydrolase
MEVVRILVRLGYDRFAGTLAGGMLSWHTSGRDSASIETITVQQLCGKLDAGEDLQVLDVRSDGERESAGSIPDALNIHLTMLPERADEVPDDGPVLVFCGSGMRSMVAASYLARRGRENLGVVLGGLSGWTSGTCRLEL